MRNTQADGSTGNASKAAEQCAFARTPHTQSPFSVAISLGDLGRNCISNESVRRGCRGKKRRFLCPNCGFGLTGRCFCQKLFGLSKFSVFMISRESDRFIGLAHNEGSGTLESSKSVEWVGCFLLIANLKINRPGLLKTLRLL